MCSLESNDPSFKEFRDMVQRRCLKSINEYYGSFSLFTKPILTQQKLKEMNDYFFQHLSTHAQIISNTLNIEQKRNWKRKQHLIGHYNRKIMYYFMATMRQRNPQYFVEWALINSGATYGTTVAGRTKLSIYFGTNLSKKVVSKQLEQISDYDAVVSKCKQTLKNETIGISIYDNTQKTVSLFYQRNGKSTECNAVTSRLFLKACIQPLLCTIDNANSHSTPITYVRQLTQPPLNFPNYVHTDTMEYLFNHPPPPQGIRTDEITGDPVKNYVYMLGILQTTVNFRHWTETAKRTNIVNAIRRGLKYNGFMKKVQQFQSDGGEVFGHQRRQCFSPFQERTNSHKMGHRRWYRD